MFQILSRRSLEEQEFSVHLSAYLNPESVLDSDNDLQHNSSHTFAFSS